MILSTQDLTYERLAVTSLKFYYKHNLKSIYIPFAVFKSAGLMFPCYTRTPPHPLIHIISDLFGNLSVLSRFVITQNSRSKRKETCVIIFESNGVNSFIQVSKSWPVSVHVGKSIIV